MNTGCTICCCAHAFGAVGRSYTGYHGTNDIRFAVSYRTGSRTLAVINPGIVAAGRAGTVMTHGTGSRAMSRVTRSTVKAESVGIGSADRATDLCSGGRAQAVTGTAVGPGRCTSMQRSGFYVTAHAVGSIASYCCWVNASCSSHGMTAKAG
jgi:hypothetical protein